MKKIIYLIILVFLAAILPGCFEKTGPAYLTITDKTYDIVQAKYNGTKFGPINHGESKTLEVTPGYENLYIEFNFFYHQTFVTPVETKSGETTVIEISNETHGFFIDDPIE